MAQCFSACGMSRTGADEKNCSANENCAYFLLILTWDDSNRLNETVSTVAPELLYIACISNLGQCVERFQQ